MMEKVIAVFLCRTLCFNYAKLMRVVKCFLPMEKMIL